MNIHEPANLVKKPDFRMEKCLIGRSEVELPEIFMEDVCTLLLICCLYCAKFDVNPVSGICNFRE